MRFTLRRMMAVVAVMTVLIWLATIAPDGCDGPGEIMPISPPGAIVPRTDPTLEPCIQREIGVPEPVTNKGQARARLEDMTEGELPGRRAVGL